MVIAFNEEHIDLFASNFNEILEDVEFDEAIYEK